MKHPEPLPLRLPPERRARRDLLGGAWRGSALARHEFLQLAAHAIESVPYRDTDILIDMGILGVAASHQFGARDGDVDSDVEGLSLAVKAAGVAMVRFDHDAAAGDLVVYLFEFEGFFSDSLLESVGMIDTMECDLKRYLHRASPLTVRAGHSWVAAKRRLRYAGPVLISSAAHEFHPPASR